MVCSRRNYRLTAGAAGLCLLAAPAFAHAPGAPDARALYVGALEILRHPTHLLPILCLGLWVGQRGGQQAIRTAWMFVVSLCAGIVLAAFSITVLWAQTGAFASMAIFGMALALRFRGPAWIALAAALTFGCCHGNVSAEGITGTLRNVLGYGFGLMMVTGALLFYTVISATRLRAFAWQIAIRVFGSWVAAGGLILLALRLRQGVPP